MVHALQDLDSPFDGFADDPGGGDADGVIFPFEGEAGDLAAVDAVVLGPADAQATAPPAAAGPGVGGGAGGNRWAGDIRSGCIPVAASEA